jgi:hypothetical protein
LDDTNVYGNYWRSPSPPLNYFFIWVNNAYSFKSIAFCVNGASIYCVTAKHPGDYLRLRETKRREKGQSCITMNAMICSSLNAIKTVNLKRMNGRVTERTQMLINP